MKKLSFLLLASLILLISSISAAPVRNMPVMRIQPNGDTLRCFVSGDEYYHRLHDADGFTIIQHPTTGWYVYADRQWSIDRSDWSIVPTNLVAGSVNPASSGLMPNIIASPSAINARHKALSVPEALQTPKALTNRNRGTINNVVIFIRFSDENEISTPYSTIEAMFNDSSANSISMHNYFWRASYSQLRIPTYFYPTPNGDSVVSYQDSHPRSYFMPYNAASNTNGYQDDDERRSREFTLLQNAVNYVSSLNIIPSGLNIDMDNDGMVDNICFIVKGTYTGWSDLLWPHKWSIYDREVTLNGKRVYTFNLQLEGSGSHYFSTSTFCHEMFHTLGAPDLYHYYDYTDISSVGSWDLMCSNTTPPQHMGMYMKMQYGKWIDTIPEITEAGTYTLNSVGDSIHTLNQCYRIKAGNPSQWYLLEYRDNTELFETGLGGRGLLIYRIDSRFPGCANFDRTNYFDEVYIFRPGGINDTTGGNISQAFFSANAGRTTFSATSNPSPWLTGNVPDTTIEISNISTAGNTISFTYTPHLPLLPDCGDSACTVTVDMIDRYGDTWNGAYLAFETTDGQCLATATMGDGCIQESKSFNLCRQPMVVKWYGGVANNECGYKIILADGSVWRNIGYATETATVGNLNDPCERYVPPTYTITVQTNDSSNYISGSGTFQEGETHIIIAQETSHIDFMGWHDGPYNGPEDDNVIHNTQRRRNITVTSDSTFTAIFKPTLYAVRVITALGQESCGSVFGSDSVPYGTSVTISAVPNEGYEFDYWRKNYSSEPISDNPFTDVVTDNVTYRAYFRSTEGILSADDNIKVYNNGTSLVVEGAAGRNIQIVNTLGQIIHSTTIDSQFSVFNISSPGLYIVRIDNHPSAKILFR